MKQTSQNESGAMSIESVIGLTFFMLAIIAIMFISMIVKVQSTMQYALSQTAKEISGYYYLLDKTGLTKLASGALSKEAKEAAEKVDNTISDVIDFSGDFENTAGDASEILDKIKNNPVDLNGIANDAESIKNNAGQLYAKATDLVKDFQNLGDNPAGQLKGIFSVFAKTMINKGLSYYITPYVCRAIMPRYLAGDTEKSNQMLEAMGIKLDGKDGLDSLDFSQSQLLADGRSIELVVIYKINPEKMTLGFVKLPENQWPVFRQTACTAAWISPDGKNTYSIVDAYDATKVEETTETN